VIYVLKFPQASQTAFGKFATDEGIISARANSSFEINR